MVHRLGPCPAYWLWVLCEPQRNWADKETVLVFADLFIETGGTAGIEFAYDKAGIN